ncbi:MAG: twin-arginine translocation signal domain-containing protein, partial [Dehalococcoidales bacterium]|nr:twin-arginine translocation signal domain-containing protein [Dehalococcoidales bacterium]
MNNRLSRRDFIKFTAAGAGALALGAVGVNRLFAEPDLKTYEETQILLGTFVTIKAVDTDEKNARSLVRA